MINTKTSGLLTAKYDSEYYQQERSVVVCTAKLTGTLNYTNTFLEVVPTSSTFETIRYYLTSAGGCEVDLSDLVRLGVTRVTLRLAYSAGGYDSTISVQILTKRDGISPAHVIIPENRFTPLFDSLSVFSYPSIILQPFTTFAASVKFLYYSEGDAFTVWYFRGRKPFFVGGWSVKITSILTTAQITEKLQAVMGEFFGVSDYTPTYTTQYPYIQTTIEGFLSESDADTFGKLVQAGYEAWARPTYTITWSGTFWEKREGYVMLATFAGANSIGLLRYDEEIEEGEQGDAELLCVTSLRERFCGRRYAEVEWQGFSGGIKRLVWEVRDVKTATIDSTELETADYSYKEIKGREDSCTLYMEGLSVFDMWYYSDIIHSSSVRITFDGVTWYNAKIDTKDFTLPNSDMALQTLKVSCKFARYDAVNL